MFRTMGIRLSKDVRVPSIPERAKRVKFRLPLQHRDIIPSNNLINLKF